MLLSNSALMSVSLCSLTKIVSQASSETNWFFLCVVYETIVAKFFAQKRLAMQFHEKCFSN